MLYTTDVGTMYRSNETLTQIRPHSGRLMVSTSYRPLLARKVGCDTCKRWLVQFYFSSSPPYHCDCHWRHFCLGG